MPASDDDDQDVFAEPAEPKAATDEPDGDSGWDDDVWGDEASPPDKKTVMLVQIGLVVLIIAIVGAVLLLKNDDKKGDEKASGGSSQTSGSGATGDTKPAGPTYIWPPSVGGRPEAFGTFNDTPEDAKGEAAPGVYIWSDYDGWHLWVQNGEGISGVSGTVAGNDNIASADVLPSGSGTATKAATVITYDLKGDQPIVGMDFNPGFYAVKLDFVINGSDGKPLPADKIFLGKEMTPSTTSPLTVEKVLQ